MSIKIGKNIKDVTFDDKESANNNPLVKILPFLNEKNAQNIKKVLNSVAKLIIAIDRKKAEKTDNNKNSLNPFNCK